jgi:signal transduction histidine kinase
MLTFFCLLIVQIAFYFVQISYEKNIVASLETILNQESVAKNPYTMSKDLEYLESIEMIRCSILSMDNSRSPYIDTSFKGNCDSSFIKLNGRKLVFQIKSINGNIWKISTFSNNSREFYLLLWFVRLLAISLGLSLLKIYEWKIKSLLLEKNIELAKKEKFSILANQVAHDIRSPLSALQIVLDEIENLPKEYRLIVTSSLQRINDIANNLLNSNRSSTEDNSDKKEELLIMLVDALISEKRTLVGHSKDIIFESDYKGSYGLFSHVNKFEIKRIISNVLDNAIDAILTNGIVKIKIFEIEEFICISIKDNGVGIPEHVLSKIGVRGYSFGKNGKGNGLGISYAKEVLEKHSGSIHITSALNEYTEILIKLKKVSPPSWFAEKLNIHEKEIIVLDDDESILEAWKERLPKNSCRFSKSEDFIDKIKNIKSKNFVVLIDYELHSEELNGLDLIKSLNIQANSILVTSRYEEKNIVNECVTNNIKILPKPLLSLIPIEEINIEDDDLLRVVWENKAKKLNVKLLTLNHTSRFEDFKSMIDKKNTLIYIDSNLSDNDLKGEEFAIILNNEGFKNLHICSGYEKERFLNYPWLKYAGKKIPF